MMTSLLYYYTFEVPIMPILAVLWVAEIGFATIRKGR